MGTGINAFVITLATASAFTGINFGITGSIPFYKMPPALVAVRRSACRRPALSSRRAADRRGVARPVLRPHRAGASPPRLRRQPARGGTVGHIARARRRHRPHALRPARAGGAVLAVARLGSAQPTIGADWLLLSFAAPIIGGAALTGGYISVLGTMFVVFSSASSERHGVGQGRPLLGPFALGASSSPPSA